MDNKALREAIDTYSELLRVHQLNIELLSTLEQSLFYVQNFCKAHKIPFIDERLCSILAKVDSLLNEISYGASLGTLCKITDENLQRKRTDGDLTKPVQPIYKGGIDTKSH